MSGSTTHKHPSPPAQPLRIGVAGIGGFAACHHEDLITLEQKGEVKVVAACDPRKDAMAELCLRYRFEGRGVEVFEDFNAMLEACGTDIDLVIVASPSQFHAKMHAECASHGLDCYLEKPPTLDPVELEEMIVRDEVLAHQTNVGFHFIHQQERRLLRERIRAHEFGRLRQASLRALACRPLDYYQRNNWAGKLMVGDTLLLDSCAGNALAHNVCGILDLLGASAPGGGWARPDQVTAELYRAYDIEAMDTVFASVLLKDGVELRLVLSHACPEEYLIVERLEFEHADVEIFDMSRFVITHRSGKTEEVKIPFDSLVENLRSHVRYLRGIEPRPAISLEDCRGFVELNALLYLAAPQITPVSSEDVVALRKAHFKSEILCVKHLDQAAEGFLSGKGFPSDLGLSWARPGGCAAAEDLRYLRDAIGRHREVRI